MTHDEMIEQNKATKPAIIIKNYTKCYTSISIKPKINSLAVQRSDGATLVLHHLFRVKKIKLNERFRVSHVIELTEE